MNLQIGKFIDQVPSGTEVRALSWNQPYASLMLHGKQETRSRYTKVRGWVLICSCAALYPDWKVQKISEDAQYMRIIQTLGKTYPATVPVSRAIAIGELHECSNMKSEDENDCFVKYNSGLFVWRFKNVHPINPMLWKGKQGWKMVDPEFVNKIDIIA